MSDLLVLGNRFLGLVLVVANIDNFGLDGMRFSGRRLSPDVAMASADDMLDLRREDSPTLNEFTRLL